MAKLTDDQIKWVLSVDANQAQQEIHKLITTNKDLATQNKEVRKEMLELEAQGKKNSDAWINLSNCMRENTAQINQNKKMISEHEKTLGLENLTMSQLKKNAQDLQKQMDATSKSLSPEAYTKLQTELVATRTRMEELKGKSSEVGSKMNEMAGGFSGFVSAAKSGDIVGMIPMMGRYASVIGLVAGALGFAKEVMMSTRATSKEFKADIEGLETAWTYLLKSVASGNFTFRGMIDAFNAGREYKLELGAITKEQQALNVSEAVAFNKRQELLEQQRNVNLDAKTRLAAGKEIIRISEEEGKVRQDIADREYNNAFNHILKITGMAKGDYETFMENYNKKDFKAISESAIQYNKHRDSLQNGIKMANLNARADNAEMAKAYQDELTKLTSSTDKETKKMGDFYHKYNMTTSKEIDEVVAAQVKSIKVKGEILAENQKIMRTNNKLEKELSDDEQKIIDERNRKAEEDRKKRQAILDAEHADRLKVLNDASVQMEIETAAYNQRLKAANLFEVDLSTLTADQLEKRTEMEEEYQKNLTKIATEAENKRFEDAKKASGLDKKDPTSLKGEELKAFETLTAQHQALLTKITEEGEKKRTDFSAITDKAILDSFKKSQESMLQTSEATKLHNLNLLKDDFVNKKNGITSQEIYDAKIIEIERDALEERLKIQKTYLATLLATQGPVTKEQQAAIKAAGLAIENTQASINDGKIKQEEGHLKKQDELIKKYRIGSIAEAYAFEKAALDKQYTEKEKKEEKYQAALLKLKLKAAKSYAEQANQIANAAASAISAYNQMETDNLEAEKQKQLSIAGDNAEQRAAVEADFAQKELDLKKKQADANMAIQIGQAIAATALGVINIWAVDGVNPILAGVLTALMVGTAAFQIESIVAQRNAIQNTTLSSSGSSSGSQGAASGSNNGYADGGYTGDGGKYDVAGYLPDGKPYHRGEYFVAQEEMANPMIMPLVRKIENVRQQRSNANPLPVGFSGGGFRQDGGLNLSQLHNTLAELTKTVKSLQEKPIRADINYYEFQQSQKQVNASFNLGKKQ